MQALVNYLFEPLNENLAANSSCNLPTCPEERNLNTLWDAVRLNDQQAYETLHQNLYPLLFNYACFILNDITASDAIIADAFVSLWYKRNVVAGADLKIVLLKRLRYKLLLHLAGQPKSRGINSFYLTPKSAITPLIMLNNAAFKLAEARLLVAQFKLNDNDLALITNNNEEVINTIS